MGAGHSKINAPDLPWYAGKIQKSEAESIVLAANPGDFLIRESNVDENTFHISINDKGSPAHYMIKQNDQGKFVMGAQAFDDVQMLLGVLLKKGLKGRAGKIHLKSPVGKASSARREGDSEVLKRVRRRTTAPWFAGVISEDEARSIVLAWEPGCFLVRTLSDYQSELVVNEAGMPNRISIPTLDNGSCKFNSKVYSSMDALVKAARKSGVPSIKTKGKVQLGQPVGFSAKPAASKAGSRKQSVVTSTADSRRASTSSLSSSYLGQPWYAGKLDRSEANNLVLGGSEGSYLIRQDIGNPKTFYLTANDHNEGTHYRISKESQGFTLGPNTFPSLDAMVQALKKNGVMGKHGKLRLTMPRIQSGPQIPTRTIPVGEEEFRSRNNTMWNAERPAKKTITKKPDTRRRPPSMAFDDDIIAPPNLTLDISPLDVEGFVALPRRKTEPTELPEYARGRKYNRYSDVLPNPVTRVRLQQQGDEEYTTYYNANYVRGFGAHNAREYIAAQAPLSHTKATFVRMMWEKKTVAVVMTTNLIEKKKKKCEPYWPQKAGEEMELDDITITNTSCKQRDGFVKSMLTFTRGSESREICHFWYNTWPDHGVPRDDEGVMQAGPLVTMMEEVRSYRRRKDNCEAPLLVHCSAGIGRTGTLIAIDQAMTAMTQSAHVDIVGLIGRCREDRMAMVQETAQYKFAYQACIEYATKHKAADGNEIYAVATKKGLLRRHSTDEQWRELPSNGAGKQPIYATVGKLRQSDEDRPVFAPEEEQSLGLPENRVVSQSPSLPRRKMGLTGQPWFRTGYSRAQVEQMLSDSPPGTFLVRESSKPGHYALSVQEGGKISNLLIIPVKSEGTTQYKLGTTTSRMFANVTELVEHYVQNPVRENDSGVHVKLVANTTGSSSDRADDDDDDAEC